MRVLWLIKGLSTGGAEQLLLNHAQASADPAFEYEVAYLRSDLDDLVPALEKAGVRTRCLANSHPLNFGWLARLRSLMAAGRYDVIHTHSPFVAPFARLIARTLPATSRPISVYTEHAHWPAYKRLTRIANRWTFGMNDAVLTVSQDVQESIHPSLRPRCTVHIHGIDRAAIATMQEDRQNVRADLGYSDDDVVIGTVANLRPSKGYSDLLAAAARLTSDSPTTQFVCIGKGPLEAELKRLHSSLNLKERFRFLGYREDAARLMSGFDIFAMTSYHEGLPVAIMEAMAMGLPIFATNVGGIPEAVSDGVEGLLVEPGDVDAIVRGLGKPVERADERRRMSAASFARSEQFDVNRSAAFIESLYVQAVATPRASRWDARGPRARQ